eukprot:17331_1
MALFWLYCTAVLTIVSIELWKMPYIKQQIKANVLSCIVCSLPLWTTVITFYQLYDLSVNEQKRFPSWVVTPWISYMGVYNPRVFAFGLTFVAIFAVIINYIFIQNVFMKNKLILTYNNKSYGNIDNIPKTWIDWMLDHNIEISAIYMVITGWINVSDGTTKEFLSVNIQTMDFLAVEWEGFVHVSSVLVFFALLWLHDIIIIIRFNVTMNPWMYYSYYVKIFIVMLTAVAQITLGYSLFYVVFIVDTKTNIEAFYFGQNLVGFCQYVVVFSYGIFWTSLGYDFVMVYDYNAIFRKEK